jgi:hypothetical protein
MFLDFTPLLVIDIKMDENTVRAPKNIERNSLTITATRSPDCLTRCTTHIMLQVKTVINTTIVYNNQKAPISLTAKLLVKEKGASPKTRDT